MTPTFKTLALAVGLSIAGISTAIGDGIDPVFDYNNQLIDDIEIMRDVTMPDGRQYAVLEMKSEFMRFYVDPDAIYVMMEASNPILVNQTVFDGFWVSTETIDNAPWPRCRRAAYDEYGTPYEAHGKLKWTNTGIAANGYELLFYIDLGTCEDAPTPWGLSRAALSPTGPGPGSSGGSTSQPSYTLTDASGIVFNVTITADGTSLDSVLPRRIEIKSNGVVTEVFNEIDQLVIYTNCSAYSPLRGWGSWSWANGGFEIGFDDEGFSFPRMDAPIENGGACRM